MCHWPHNIKLSHSNRQEIDLRAMQGTGIVQNTRTSHDADMIALFLACKQPSISKKGLEH